MRKTFYLILIICILISNYSLALANSPKELINSRMAKLITSVEINNLKEFLSCFSKDYCHQSKNEHGTEITERYSDLRGRFPYNDDIEKINIEPSNVKIIIKEDRATYTANWKIYTEYKNGLSYTKEDTVSYKLIKEKNSWLIIDIN